MNMGDDEAAVGASLVEDAGVVDALGHALLVDKVFVVLGLPDDAGVSAASHVSCNPDHVGGAMFVVCRKVAVLAQPGWNAGKDEAAAISEGWPLAFIVGATYVDGVLEGTVFHGDL